MSSYAPTDWVDGSTPLDEAHFDKIEQAIRKRQATEGGALTAAASITVTDAVHAINNGATISTINGGVAGQLLVLYAVSGQTFTLDSAGNIWATPAGGALVVASNQAVLLYFTGSQWRPVGSVSTGGGGGGGLDWEGAWAGATPYVKGDVVTYQGVTYGAVNDSTGQTPPGVQPLVQPVTPVPIVTSLPATPFDGQEVIFVDVLGAATYSWHLRYVAARVTNKWIFLGGASQVAEIAASEALGGAANTYNAAPTNGPILTIPLSGDYMIAVSCIFTSVNGCGRCQMSYDIGATPASDADEGSCLTTANGDVLSIYRERQKTGLVAGTALTAKYRQGGANTGGPIAHRQLHARPIAVGG
jgi:hypothetical protein